MDAHPRTHARRNPVPQNHIWAVVLSCYSPVFRLLITVPSPAVSILQTVLIYPKIGRNTEAKPAQAKAHTLKINSTFNFYPVLACKEKGLTADY